MNSLGPEAVGAAQAAERADRPEGGVLVKRTPTLLSILAGIGAAVLGRWLGLSWPLAVVVGISVWLIITGLLTRKG